MITRVMYRSVFSLEGQTDNQVAILNTQLKAALEFAEYRGELLRESEARFGQVPRAVENGDQDAAGAGAGGKAALELVAMARRGGGQ